MTRALVGILAGLLLGSFALSAPPPESWKIVRGKAVHDLFEGRELGDGVHYAYRFRADGTFAGTEMGRDVRGTWRVSGSEICWTWIRPRGAEECYAVRIRGSEASLLRNGVEQWYGTLKPAR